MRSKSEEGWVMRFAGFRARRVQGSEFRVQGLREHRKSFVALTPNLSRNSEL